MALEKICKGLNPNLRCIVGDVPITFIVIFFVCCLTKIYTRTAQGILHSKDVYWQNSAWNFYFKYDYGTGVLNGMI